MDEFLVVKNGIVLPFTCDNKGGVCDANGDFLPESKLDGEWLKIGGGYSINEFENEKKKVIYLGFCVNHWGHFIIDCLGRAWILSKPEFSNYDIVFLSKKGTIEGNYLEFFELLGVDRSRFIDVKKNTRFDEIVIPHCANILTEPSLYYCPFAEILRKNNFPNVDEKNVYLSRRHLTKARKSEIGEKDIEQIFVQNGYKVCYPEEMSLRQQITLFQKCSQIACINGTIPLNGIFGRNDLRLIVMNKVSLAHNNLYVVSKMSKISPIYINVFKEPIPGYPKSLGVGPFWMIVSSELKDFLRNNGMRECNVKFYFLKNLFNYPYYIFLFIKIYFVKKLKKIMIRARNFFLDLLRKK